MKILNDNTIKQLGNGILEKVRGKYCAMFTGTYVDTTGGFNMSPYNSINKVAINIGDIIAVYHNTLSETIYYSDTDIPLYDSNYDYSLFTVINITVDLDGSIYIIATDKFGNTCKINSASGTTFFITLDKTVIPCTWDHTVWNSSNRIESLLLDSKIRLFKEGDKIKFGNALDEDFFNKQIVEIKKIEISEYTDNTHFKYKLTLENDFGSGEKVLMECNGTMSGSITEKQRRITTNCPTYILGRLNSTSTSVTECFYIFLPKSNTVLEYHLYDEYYPKPGDIVCSITDDGWSSMSYLGNIIYVDFNSTTPYAIINVQLIASSKFLIIGNSFIEEGSGGGNSGVN